MKQLYNRICTCCGVMFQSPQKRKRLCPKCEAEAKASAKKAWSENATRPCTDRCSEPTKKPVLSFGDICRIQKQHYEATKKYLHYGDVVEHIRTGKIKVIHGKDGAEYGGETE